MQLEELSKDELIGMIAKQDEFLRQERHINALLLTQVEQLRKEASDTVAITLAEFKDARSNSAEIDGIKTAARPVQQPAPACGDCSGIGQLSDDLGDCYSCDGSGKDFAAPVAAPVAMPFSESTGPLWALARDWAQAEPGEDSARKGRTLVEFLNREAVPAASVQPETPTQMALRLLKTDEAFRDAILADVKAAKELESVQPDSGRDAALVETLAVHLVDSIGALTDVDEVRQHIRTYLAAHPANVAQAVSDAALMAAVTALAWKWHRDAVKDGFACSEPAQELFEVLGWPADPAMSAPAKTDGN